MAASYIDINRVAWDQRTEVHRESRFYDVAGFLEGNTSLREIELSELTDVRGRRLLHLQCHFGLDTLSWARLGATCTGVDLSPVAIDEARRLNGLSGQNAQFVCSNVYDYARGTEEPFDIVFASYGALCWLPDLARWAGIVSSNLAVGGTFYLAEFHPVRDLLTGYSYFEADEPDVEEEGTYTENGAELSTRTATWAHPLSSVINALIDAGISIHRLSEFPFSPYNCFDAMEEREEGRFYFTQGGHDVPLVYSVTGEKIA